MTELGLHKDLISLLESYKLGNFYLSSGVDCETYAGETDQTR